MILRVGELVVERDVRSPKEPFAPFSMLVDCADLPHISDTVDSIINGIHAAIAYDGDYSEDNMIERIY